MPWLDAVVVAAALAACLAVDRPRRALAVLGALAVVAIALTLGVATFGTEGAAEYGAGITYALVAVAGAAVGAAWVARRPAAWAPATLLAGVVIVVAGGFTFLGWLTHSQLPVSLPAALARAIVAALLGGGAGCVITGVRHLRIDAPTGESAGSVAAVERRA